MQTTIRLSSEIKSGLDSFRQYKNESYNEVIRKLLFVAKICATDPKLSQRTIKEINDARERIKKGELYSEKEAKKILGI
jgi:predicted transcriptional regulator